MCCWACSQWGLQKTVSGWGNVQMGGLIWQMKLTEEDMRGRQEKRLRPVAALSPAQQLLELLCSLITTLMWWWPQWELMNWCVPSSSRAGCFSGVALSWSEPGSSLSEELCKTTIVAWGTMSLADGHIIDQVALRTWVCPWQCETKGNVKIWGTWW